MSAPAPRCVVLGAGGHARVVIECLRASRAGQPELVLDPDTAKWGGPVDGVAVVGGDELLPELAERGITHFIVGVGSVHDNRPRQAVFDRAVTAGLTALTARHPAAVVSSTAEVGAGSLLAPACVVNAGAVVGRDVILNTGSIVEHECWIGDHVHLASRACLGGGVRVCDLAFVGAGAVVREGVEIGRGAVVGAGAVVLGDVPPGTTAVGVPARTIRGDVPAAVAMERRRP